MNESTKQVLVAVAAASAAALVSGLLTHYLTKSSIASGATPLPKDATPTTEGKTPVVATPKQDQGGQAGGQASPPPALPPTPTPTSTSVPTPAETAALLPLIPRPDPGDVNIPHQAARLWRGGQPYYWGD